MIKITYQLQKWNGKKWIDWRACTLRNWQITLSEFRNDYPKDRFQMVQIIEVREENVIA